MRNDFIKYLANNGIKCNIVKSDNPDTFESLFGGSFLDEEDNDGDFEDLWGGEEDNDESDDEDDTYDELDFVQPHEKIKVNLKVDKDVEKLKECLGGTFIADLNNAEDKEIFFSELDKGIENEKRISNYFIDKANALDNIPLFGMGDNDKKELDECYAESRRHLQLYEWLKDYKSLLLENLSKEKTCKLVESDSDDFMYCCSVCGKVPGPFKYGKPDYDYCPYCGSKMIK